MKIGDTEFLIGADPEFFLRDKATGELVSAHGLLPGDKKNPHKVPKGAVQIDGMAVEFNIDPVKTRAAFIKSVKSVLNTIDKMLKHKYEFVFESTAHFGKELIDAQPEEAKELGCDPDFNAWTGKENPVPDAEKPFRTGAGHIHIGWTNGQSVKSEDHLDVCRHLIRHLDYFCMPMILVDKDSTRRELYGATGAFRPKPYGVEYRTPSNFWLQSDETMGFMFDMIVGAIKKLVDGMKSFDLGDNYYHERIADTTKLFYKPAGLVLGNHNIYRKQSLLSILRDVSVTLPQGLIDLIDKEA